MQVLKQVVSSHASAKLSLVIFDVGGSKSLICIRVESLTSPIVITQRKSPFLHIQSIIKWKGLLMRVFLIQQSQQACLGLPRLAQACPLSNLSSVCRTVYVGKISRNKRSDHLATRKTAYYILLSAQNRIYKQNTYTKWI